MIEHKNTILAIVLSLIVVVGWNFFIAKPQIERQQHEAQLKQQEQTQLQPQAQPGGGAATPAPQTGAPAVPGGPVTTAQPAAPGRETVIAAAPHVPIQTPRLNGSINLKGARIDNLSLEQYRETVDPQFAADRAVLAVRIAGSLLRRVRFRAGGRCHRENART